jgi:hypothetical protein
VKAQAGSRGPVLRAQCVISPDNVDHLDRTADAVREMGLAEVRFQHLMFAFSREAFQPDNEIRKLVARGNVSRPILEANSLDLARLRSQLSLLRKRRGLPRIRFEPDIRPMDLEGYYRNAHHAFRSDCLSPWRRLVISADGGLGPCQGMCLERYPETPALRAWNGEHFRSLRAHIRGSGLFPHCLRCCHRQYYRHGIGLEVA